MADSAAGALCRICSLQASTARGITTYPAALRHRKTHFHTIKPVCIVLSEDNREKPVVVEHFNAITVFYSLTRCIYLSLRVWYLEALV